jgi:hypothetical protein
MMMTSSEENEMATGDALGRVLDRGVELGPLKRTLESALRIPKSQPGAHALSIDKS